MDAIELLKQDHRMVEETFKQFEEAGERATSKRRTLVEKLTTALVPHMGVEEQHFYPLARERLGGEGKHLVLESFEEHHLVKVLLKELATLSADDERYEAKVTVLKEVVMHHVKEEEEEIFPKVAKATSREELADLGELLEKRKMDVPARPNPDVIGIVTARRRTTTTERGRITTRSLAARTARAGAIAATAKRAKSARKAPSKTTARKTAAKKTPTRKSPSRGRRRREQRPTARRKGWGGTKADGHADLSRVARPRPSRAAGAGGAHAVSHEARRPGVRGPKCSLAATG